MSSKARYFLLENLKEPMDVRRLRRRAKQANINVRSMYRASKQLGVSKKVRGFGDDKTSVWSLAESKRENYLTYERSRHEFCTRLMEELESKATHTAADYEHDLYKELRLVVRSFRSRVSRQAR